MNILEFDERTHETKLSSEAAVREYLVSNGWKYNSDNPGSILLWTITREESTHHADDGTMLERTMRRWSVNESTALQFQRYWELEARQFPVHDDTCPVFETFDWETCTCMESDAEA